MNTQQIYSRYLIPPNLQEHMLRVAALAQIILEHWKGPRINKNAIILACLFHDIAKPINFDPTQNDKLAKLQHRLKNSYGDDEHRVAVKICQEIGLNEAVTRLVDNTEWKFIPRLIKAHDLESLIPIYCDMRIGPNGILSLKARVTELHKRRHISNHQHHLQNGQQLQKLIQQNTQIDITTITDNQFNSYFPIFLNQKI